MSKSYKKKREQEEVVEEVLDGLSKKEQYDLEKKKRLDQKEKNSKKKKASVKKNKSSKKTYQTNLAGRIFAVVMLVLMIGSVVASVASYLSYR